MKIGYWVLGAGCWGLGSWGLVARVKIEAQLLLGETCCILKFSNLNEGETKLISTNYPASRTQHQEPSTKNQAPRTKNQAPRTKHLFLEILHLQRTNGVFKEYLLEHQIVLRPRFVGLGLNVGAVGIDEVHEVGDAEVVALRFKLKGDLC